MNIRFFKIFTYCTAIILATTSIQYASILPVTSSLQDCLIANANKPFTIEKAVYKSTSSSKQKDIASLLQKEADKGLLLLPKNMNATFGDPAPNELKHLDITFKMNTILYYFNLSENWYRKLKTPAWFKNQNQYLLLESAPVEPAPAPDPIQNPASPWPPAGAITLDQLKVINDLNQRNSFVVKQALYGDLSDPKLYGDFASMFATSAQLGAFVIPQKMIDVFGDTAPGYVKKLKITYLINQKEYILTLPEFWTRPSWITSDLNNIPPVILNMQQLKGLLIKNNKAPFTLIEVAGDPYDGWSWQPKIYTTDFQPFANRGLFLNPYAPETFKQYSMTITFLMNNQKYSICFEDPKRKAIFPPGFFETRVLTPEQIIERDDFLASCKDLIIQYQ